MTEAARSSISETSSVEHHAYSIGDDIDDFELQQRLKKVEREIIELKFENTIFEINLERKKNEQITQQEPPASAAASSSQTATPTGSYQDVISTGGTSRGDRLARKRSKSRSTQADFRIQLTLEQKIDIVALEYEQMKTDKIRREIANKKKIDQLESDVEWIDVEMQDFELVITDFLKARELSIDKRSHKLIGEKIDRYFHEHLKARESLVNKLRDRSVGFKRQITHLENQLRQKEEMGETLNEVDFNQLKIENKQYLDKIDEKNIELVLFKRQVAHATQLVNSYKDELYRKTKELMDLEQRIDKQRILYEYSQQEFVTASYDQSRAARVHYHLTEQTENYHVPEILDYVKKKALLYSLQRDCEVWERKVDLVSMAFKQAKQQWQGLQRTARYQTTDF